VSQGALLKLAFLQMRADLAVEERDMEDKLDEQNQVNHIVIQFALRTSVPSSSGVDSPRICKRACEWESGSSSSVFAAAIVLTSSVCCAAFEWMLKTERMMHDAMEVTVAKQRARRSEMQLEQEA
jgi:hypothetical protein